MSKVIFGCLIFGLVTFSIHAIAQKELPNDLFFHHLNPKNGLSQASNHFIYKDSKGFTWISSISGLNRFDGNEVVIYNPIPDDSTSIVGNNIQGAFGEDKNGNIWFCTYEAVNCYIRETGRFEHYLLKNDNDPGYFSCGLDKNGTFWVIHKTSLFHFDIHNKKFRFINTLTKGTNRGTYYLDPKNEKSLFISYTKGRTGLLLTRYLQGSVFQEETFFSGNDRSDHPDLVVYDIKIESDSIAWLGTNKGLVGFNPNERTIITHSENKNFPSNRITSVEIFDENYLLVNPTGKGIQFIPKKNDNLFATRQFQHSESMTSTISSNNIGNIYVDNNKNIWLNNDFVGVDYSSPLKAKFHRHFSGGQDKNHPNPVAIAALMESKTGELWVGTYSLGLWILDDHKMTLKKVISKDKFPKFTSNQIIQLIEDEEGYVWVFTWQGVFRIHQEERIPVKIDTKGHTFLHAILIEENKILATSYKPPGIFLMQYDSTGELKFEEIYSPEIPEITYTYLQKGSDGGIYACENLTSLVKFNFDSDKPITKRYPVKGEIKSIFEPKNDSMLWIASSYGLVRLNKQTAEIKYFSIKDGLPNSFVYSVLEDEFGHLWLSTNNGLARFNIEKEEFKTFGLADGLSGVEYNTNSFLKRSNGEFWFGSISGLTTFFPADVKSRLPFPKIQTTVILINDEEWPNLACSLTGAKNPGEIKELDLEYGRNTLSFTFTSIEYSDPSNNKTKYRMKGVDQNWVNAGPQGFARYPNLRPGNYDFEIKAANSDGEWNEKEIRSVRIVIQPPFYLTWWFILICSVSLISVSYLSGDLYRKRKAKIAQLQYDKEMAAEKERMRIAGDMHDELGSELSALSLLVSRVRSGKRQEDLIQNIEKIDELSQRLSLNIRESIWVVKPVNDTLENLIFYLHELAADFFGMTTLECNFILPSISKSAVPGRLRRNVLLTFKEALNNIIKHAEASKVSINFTEQGSKAEISISDNGIGLTSSSPNQLSGNGIENMKKRMKEIGGSCLIQSDQRGTTVRILFSI